MTGGREEDVHREILVPKPLSPISGPLVFRRYTYEQLATATNNFSRKSLVSEGGPDATNVVYKGRLGGQQVAVKKLHRKEWPIEHVFLEEVEKVGNLRFGGLVSLLGFCSYEKTRLLVADFMPKSTLTQHLFHYEKRPMTWSQRLTVSLTIAKTVDFLAKEGFTYPDLNSYRVLFDANLEPHLSSFGLMKSQNDGSTFSLNLASVPPEFITSESRRVTSESTVYTYGTLLLALLSGKTIRPNQFLDLVGGNSAMDVIVDSALMERQGTESAMELIPLVADCLKINPQERPTLEQIIQKLEIIQAGTKVEIASRIGSPDSSPLSPSGDSLFSIPPGFAQAAFDGDFKKLHILLVKEMYGTPPQEPSFEFWKPEMQEMLDARKKGDQAFKSKKWEEAIQFYGHFRKLDTAKQALMFARRALCYLQLGQWDNALTDAMTVHYENKGWPEGCYLQAAALKKLNLEEDAMEMLVLGVNLERERRLSAEHLRSQSPSPRRSR